MRNMGRDIYGDPNFEHLVDIFAYYRQQSSTPYVLGRNSGPAIQEFYFQDEGA